MGDALEMFLLQGKAGDFEKYRGGGGRSGFSGFFLTKEKSSQEQGWSGSVCLRPGETEHMGLALQGGLPCAPGKCLWLDTRWECGTEGPWQAALPVFSKAP